MSWPVRQFSYWFRHEKSEHQLFDVKFYPGENDDTDTEAFFDEVNRMLKARSRFAFSPHADLY